jgi:NAD(P)-dependent dehydrogenase (short-subunit alcohol dehydrogenase family)
MLKMGERVKDKVVVITGAGVGLGKAMSETLAAEGATVAVTDILEDEGKATVREIEKAGGKARFWSLDVTRESDVERVMGEVVEAFGEIDVLVNNAGISGADKPPHEITEEEWDKVQDVNVKGVFFCTKHVIPSMKRKGGGSIIHLSSIYGLVGAPDAPPYHASKGAVRLMAKTDALFYAGDGIRVNSIHPGFIWTPMVKAFIESTGVSAEEGRKNLASLHPIGRVGDPMDIAYGVLYLASDESAFVTGSELVIDGGYTAK